MGGNGGDGGFGGGNGGNGGAGGDNQTGVGGNGGNGGKGGHGEQIMEAIYRKVRQRLEKRPEETFVKTMPLIRKAKLVGNGIAL